MRTKAGVFTLSALCLALFAAGAIAADSIGEPGRSAGGKNPLNNVYFGEQHLHTSASPDAFAFGTRNDANDAYRYAKGEAIKNAQSGEMIQKRTPYDWAAVTDHAEYLGMMPLLLDPNSPLQKTEIGKLISNVSNSAMFALHTSTGNPIAERWAYRSARNSPAVEIVQTKGASETHPALSPNDEFAGFESKFTHLLGSGGVLGLIDKSFVRNALIDGVGFQEMIGANPFKYGIVAGADSHIATSANEEFNYPGLQEKLPPSGFHIGTLEKK